MQSSRLLFLPPLVLALLVACSSEQPAQAPLSGEVHLAASTRQALSASDVSRVTVTSSAADMPPITTELVQTDGVWGGVIGNIPAGPGRTFHAQAFDAAGTLRYEGQAVGITIVAGEVTLVTLTLQELSSGNPFANEAPIIDSVVASPLIVAPGGTVTLVATAHDPNPGDTLVYAWSAPVGSFATPSAANTTWSAPALPGPTLLTLTVSDPLGAASSVSLTVRVTTGEGGTVLDVRFNSRPVVMNLTSSHASLGVGQPAVLSVLATDSDGDPLAYQWSASCPGTWSGANTPTAQFAPTSVPTATCNNCQVSVLVSDGRGSQSTATLALCVTQGALAQLPPTLVRSYQSALSAQPNQQLTFEVVASDPQSSPLSFAWSAPAGALSAPVNSATSSRVRWLAPTCTPAGASFSVTATITNGFGLSTSRAFSVAVPSCVQSAWTPTAAMASPRMGHTATLLGNDQVLVTGGYMSTSGAPAGTAELYDPASGTWSSTNPMLTARAQHTATRLNNGKVLVVGGYHLGTLASAELYDPATSAWSPAGSLASPRYAHTATLLGNGKVLVVGGRPNDLPYNTAEVYDPATNTWAPAGTLLSARESHTATLLPNGKVLVTGGSYNTTQGLTLTEVYEPATNTWSSSGHMSATRRYHRATLLPNGKVLVSGGFDGVSFNSVDVYDLAANAWAPAPAMASIRYAHTATLLGNGKVLVAGGVDPNTGAFSGAEVFDPATGTWSSTTPMSSSRMLHTATLLSTGKVLVTGGSIAGTAQASAELYTP